MAEYKSKGKQPYIPIYIGDWEQDTNCISLEAEGALLKLIFKLWKSDTKGLLSFSFSQIAILLKKSEEMTTKILQELQENKVLNIEFLPEKKVKIESRRMLKDVAISESYSKRGKQGGRPKKLNESKLKAKYKLFTDNEYDNESKEKRISASEISKKDEILNSKIWIQSIAMQKRIPETEVISFLSEFLSDLILKEDFIKPVQEIKKHFISWLNIQLKNNATSKTTNIGNSGNKDGKRASRDALGAVARQTIGSNSGQNDG